jgi:hypothetical protein
LIEVEIPSPEEGGGVATALVRKQDWNRRRPSASTTTRSVDSFNIERSTTVSEAKQVSVEEAVRTNPEIRNTQWYRDYRGTTQPATRRTVAARPVKE